MRRGEFAEPCQTRCLKRTVKEDVDDDGEDDDFTPCMSMTVGCHPWYLGISEKGKGEK